MTDTTTTTSRAGELLRQTTDRRQRSHCIECRQPIAPPFRVVHPGECERRRREKLQWRRREAARIASTAARTTGGTPTPPAGKLLWAHLEVTKGDADQAVSDYEDDSRNRDWQIEVHERTVSAGGVEIPVWMVIVRPPATPRQEKPKP